MASRLVQARGRDLEAAHGEVPLPADGPRRDRPSGTLNPYALFQDQGAWYIVGHDLEREEHPHVPRLAHPRRDPLRDAPRARLPDPAGLRHRARYRDRPPWQIGELVGEARIEVHGDTAWWVERTYGDHGRVEDGVFVTEYANLAQLASWVLRQDGRAVPVSPQALRREVADALRARPRAARGRAAADRRRRDPRESPTPSSGPTGPVAPERFAVLQSLLAYLLDACGDEREATIPATDLVERVPHPVRAPRGAPLAAQPRQLRRRLLRRLRRAARRRGARRQGAARRHVPRVAAADAARGAGDPARARVRRADDRGRRAHAARPRAPQARGDVRRVRPAADARAARRRRGGPRGDAHRGRSASAGSSRSST